MRIIATMIAGGGTAEMIGDALRSAAPSITAAAVLLTADDSDVVRAIERSGVPFAVQRWPWRNDFAAARNAALDFAAECSADWAITLDTDERIEPNGDDIRAFLASTDAPAVRMTALGDGYSKVRALRMPCAARWSGATHEAIVVRGPVFERARFWELPKTAEQLKHKFERDVGILREEIARSPREPRWHYYLGASLDGLGRYEEAARAFADCAALRGWDEESAWACYRAAQILTDRLGRHEEALDVAANGLARHAGIAELAWIAGLAAYRLGRHEQAVYWARLALVHRDGMALDKRIGFRAQKGLRQGPWDVLRFALRAIGDGAGADVAEKEYRRWAA